MAKVNWNGTTQERFLRKVKKTKDCWFWTAKKAGNGYGQICVDQKYMYAHRYSYEFYNKTKIKKGMCILHKCDNPACVNPNHLWEGTREENSQDMTRKGRHCNNRGENCGQAKLTWEKVVEIRNKYQPRKLGRYKLAILYNVSPSTIRSIITNHTWVKK